MQELVQMECSRWASKGLNIKYEVRNIKKLQLNWDDQDARDVTDYHFIVEQEVGSCTYAFFGFNGIAGVWRISTLYESGGWNHRTTVEILFAPSKYTPSFMDLPPRETMKMDLHNKKSMPSMSPKKKLTAKFALMKSRPLSEQEILTEVTALVTKQFAMQEILSEEFRHCRIRKLS
ncbi:hypothetical protein JHK82_016766 [Glycine max]|nr:hypothetical protein JHK82_016766 [Glycine max]